MYQVIIVIHVLLGLGIIGLILMQQGKGADAGAAFGTGSAGSVFGAQGAASFLSRATAILATLFFITSLGLAIINGHKGVAYDLMSSSDVKEETSGAPQLEGQTGVDSAAGIPAIKAEDIPQVKTVESVKGTEIKDTQVPKAEAMKTVK
jgi:preprotein translocase subunit SecG